MNLKMRGRQKIASFKNGTPGGAQTKRSDDLNTGEKACAHKVNANVTSAVVTIPHNSAPVKGYVWVFYCFPASQIAHKMYVSVVTGRAPAFIRRIRRKKKEGA